MSDHTDPVRLDHVWLWPDGTTAPIISGGDGSAEGDGGAGAEGDQGDQGGQEGDGGQPGKTFTQTELETELGRRLNRERARHAEELKELRGKASKFDELEAAGQSDLDRANARAEAAEQRATAALDAANGRLRKAAIVTAARDTADPELVARLLSADADAISVDDDGNVIGVDDAIAELLKAHPALAKSGGQGGENNDATGNGSGNGTGKFDGGARGNAGGGDQHTRRTLQTMTPTEVAKLTPEQVAAAMARP